MKVLLSPQISDNTITYEFSQNYIKVRMIYNDTEYIDSFDFSGFSDGQLEVHDEVTGEPNILVDLPVNPLLLAKREKGILWVKLLNWIDIKEKDEDVLFPDWIDYKNLKNNKRIVGTPVEVKRERPKNIDDGDIFLDLNNLQATENGGEF